MLCGSVPPGVAPDFYARIIRLAQKANVKTLLDTDGDALVSGMDAGPTAVAPNQAEAERLLNRALITQAHFRNAASRMVSMGAASAILSLGSRGAVAANKDTVLSAAAPSIDAVCPIGAGRRVGGGVRLGAGGREAVRGSREVGRCRWDRVGGAAWNFVSDLGADGKDVQPRRIPSVTWRIADALTLVLRGCLTAPKRGYWSRVKTQ